MDLWSKVKNIMGTEVLSLCREIVPLVSFGAKPAKIKVPTILQMEAAECGAACLGMILAYYGLWLPPEELREKCGVGRDGSKAANILRAAVGLDCEAAGYRWTAEDLRELSAAGEPVFPLIVYWEHNHFAILEGFTEDKVRLNDPAMGRRRVSWRKFCNSYAEIALHIKPGKNFRPAGQSGSIWRELWDKLRQDRQLLPLLLLLTGFLVVPGAILPLLNQIYIDNILTYIHPEWLPGFGISVAVSGILSLLIVWLRARILHNWEYRLSLTDTAGQFWHLLNLPLSFFRHRYASELALQANIGADVSRFVAGTAVVTLLDFGVAGCYFVLLSLYNLSLALLGLLLNLISVGAFYVTQNKLQDLTLNIQQNSAKEYGVLSDGLRRLESLRIGGGEADFFGRWVGYHTKVLRDSQKAAVLSVPLRSLPHLLAGLNGALIMIIGGFSVMEGAMTAGMYVAFLHLMRSFRRAPDQLNVLAAQWRNFTAQVQRSRDLTRAKSMPSTIADKTNEFIGRRLTGEISLTNISFGYNRTEAPLLCDFTLHVAAGQRVALVGKSGSGKSTVAKIAAGLIEAWNGKISLDGTDRRLIPPQTIAESVAAVDQDICFVRGSIADNIAMFDTTMRRSDIIRAAQDACIHDDILRLNGGYDAKVSEDGKNFSGGERQRLEIARALATNPVLLILDEATCALDTITEKQVLTNIRRRGCTCLIVAHRLSTVKSCDKIVVLERGHIVESGTHRELMERRGAYWQLVKTD